MRHQSSRILDIWSAQKPLRKRGKKSEGGWLEGPAVICNSQSESTQAENPSRKRKNEYSANKACLHAFHMLCAISETVQVSHESFF